MKLLFMCQVKLTDIIAGYGVLKISIFTKSILEIVRTCAVSCNRLIGHICWKTLPFYSNKIINQTLGLCSNLMVLPLIGDPLFVAELTKVFQIVLGLAVASRSPDITHSEFFVWSFVRLIEFKLIKSPVWNEWIEGLDKHCMKLMFQCWNKMKINWKFTLFFRDSTIILYYELLKLPEK